MLKALTTKTVTKENPDGTVTVTTITYKADGTKSSKSKTTPRRTRSTTGIGSGPTPVFPKDTRNMNNRSLNASSNHSRLSSLSSTHSRMNLTEMVEEVKLELTKILGKGHKDDEAFAASTSRAIPCEIVLIASQDDVTQAQEGDTALKKYKLPEIEGIHNNYASLATCAFLQLLYENPKRVIAGSGEYPFNCFQCIKEIQQRVRDCSSLQEANPVISSSRPLGPPAIPKHAPFYLVPPGFTGTRRALLISATKGESDIDLKGPPNDILQVKHFLTNHAGFKEKDIIVLRDDPLIPDGVQLSTKQNCLNAFAQMAKLSKPKDVVFIQFSGHGGRLGDDLFILPTDYKTNGQIMDYDILRDLTKNLPAKVHATMLVDCCYSGCIGDRKCRF